MKGYTNKPRSCEDCNADFEVPYPVMRKRCPGCAKKAAERQRKAWKARTAKKKVEAVDVSANGEPLHRPENKVPF